MKRFKILLIFFIFPLLLNSAQSNITKSQFFLEKKAINYYYQGDYENYFNTILKLINLSPYTMISRFYLTTLKIEKSMIKNYDKIFATFEKLIQSPEKLDFFTYQLILNDLIEFYLQKGKIDKAKKLFKKTGCINQWNYTGPFIKTYYNDINENFFGIEDTISFTETENYKWKRLRFGTEWGWVPFGFVLYPSYNITAYAGCNIYFPSDMKIIIWVTSQSSIKLFLNSQLVFINDTRTDKAEMNIIYKLQIKKGWYHLVVKSTSYQNAADFKLRILSEDGSPIKNLKVSLADEEIIKNFKIKKEKIYPQVYQYFTSQIKKYPNKGINYFRKAILDFNIFSLMDAKKRLLKATIVEKKNPLFKYYLGRFYYYSYIHFHRDYEIIKARQMFEEALKLKKNFIRAKEYLARCYLELNKIDTAYNYISGTLKKKDYASLRTLFSRYFNKINWKFLEIESLKRAHSLNNTLLFPIKKTASFYKDYDVNKALHLYEQIFEKDYASISNKDLFELYIKTKQYNKLLEKLNYLKSVSPYIENYYQYLALYYESIKKYKEALKVLNDYFSIHPYPEVLNKIANIYYKINNYKMAKNYWQESLHLQPSNSEIEDRIYFLQNKEYCEKNLETEFYPVDTEEIINKAFKEDVQKNDIKYYLDLMIIKINRDGTFRYLVHQIIKIIREKGKERYGEIPLPYGMEVKIIKIGTYLSQNEFIEATDYKYHNNKNYISFPALKKGALIEIWYEVNTGIRWLDNTPYFYYPPFMFQEKDADVENSIFVVIKEKDYPEVKFSLRNGKGVKFYKKKKNDKIIMIWEKEYSEALKIEYNLPPLLDIVPNIFISTIPNWDVFSKWYYGKIKEKLRWDFELEQKILELYEKSKINHKFSVPEFIKNTYYWIQENISTTHNYLYYPNSIDEVFFKKQGNAEEKTLLMKYMLDSININSYIVLVRDNNFSMIDFKMPTPDAFNSILLYVPVGSKSGDSLWIDFQEKYIPFGYVNFSRINTNAFLINDFGEYKFVKVTPISNESKIKEEFEVKLHKKEKNIKIIGKLIYKGIFNTRKYIYIASSTRETEVLERINKCIEGISILNFSISNVEDVKKDLMIKFAGEIEFEGDGEIKLDLMFDKLKLSERYISKSEQKFPLKIYEPVIKEIKIVVNLNGFKLKKKILSQSLKKDFGEYSLNISYTDTKITIIRKVKILPTLIPPERYREFLNFCSKVDHLESEKFSIKE